MRWDRRVCKCGAERDYRADACRACWTPKGDKRCPKCDRTLPRTEFYFRKNGRIVSECKKCSAELNKARPKNHNKSRNYKVASDRIMYRRKTDPTFKLKEHLRSFILRAAKRNGGVKSNRTVVLLGCSIPAFRKHIEDLWVSGMSWENHGRKRDCWHLDHIKPVSSFDLSKPEQQKLCFHYTNYRPLWALENIAKGATTNWDLVK